VAARANVYAVEKQKTPDLDSGCDRVDSKENQDCGTKIRDAPLMRSTPVLDRGTAENDDDDGCSRAYDYIAVQSFA
jgi:hypothetical protein